MSDTQERITLILTRLQGTNLEPRAQQLVRVFATAVRLTLRARLPQKAKQILIERRRDMLFAALCDLVAPLGLSESDNTAGRLDSSAESPTIAFEPDQFGTD